MLEKETVIKRVVYLPFTLELGRGLKLRESLLDWVWKNKVPGERS